jgi:predicted kinase
MESPTLYIFSGLPGSGKTVLSQHLASHVHAVHLRIDTIEQGLRDLCGVNVAGEGYQLAYRVAADNLKLGLSVVADSCNPWELTRREWEDVAKALELDFVNVEVICSDKAEHRRRVEARLSTVPNLKLPTWEQVESRDYHSWTVPRIVVDTDGRSVDESFSDLLSLLPSAVKKSGP